MAILRLILGDQLSSNISSLRDIDPLIDLVVMMEVRPETEYVAHHKRKIAFLFSAMRHFAKSLSQIKRKLSISNWIHQITIKISLPT